MTQCEMDNWFEKEKLHFAVQEVDIEEVKRLIASGADINYFDEIQHTPLHYAVKQENFQIAQLLLDNGANINACDIDNIGNTPLREVADTCTIKIANYLIQNGADPTITGWMQLTALHLAKQRKKDEGVEVYNLLKSSVKKYL